MFNIVFNPNEEFGIKKRTRLLIRDKVNNKYFINKAIGAMDELKIDSSLFDNHWYYRYKYQVRERDEKTGNMRWVDATKFYPLYPERKNEDGLKYLLYENKNSNKLIIIYQAINTRPGYNYVGLLSNVEANRLYIKDDYGNDRRTKSSYYLGSEKDLSIADATQKLIDHTAKKLNIEKRNTIFIGSSKGGFAALYHGYLYGAGHILPGGPQVLLGDYLDVGHTDTSVSRDIFKSVIGEINAENKEWANNLLFNVLENVTEPYPNTVIHVGYWEPHFKNHVYPLMEKLKALRINNVSLVTQNYGKHSDLATFYPIFLREQIGRILSQE